MDLRNFKIENGIMKGSEKVFDAGNANLGKWFLDTLRSKPDFVGQVDPISKQETTYGKMADESVRCALWLKKQGLNFGDIVFTCSNNRLTTYIPVLATIYNGASHIFGYKGIQFRMTRYIFSLLKPKFIFTEEEGVKMFDEVSKQENLNVKIITFTKVPGYYYLNDIIKECDPKEVNKFCSLQPLNPNDNCFLALTSGTTSDPKVAAHSYKSTMEGLLVHVNDLEKTESAVALIYLPRYWLIALRIMLTNILNFTKLIVVNETTYDLHEVFNIIEEYKVTKVRFSLGMIYRMYKWKQIKMYDTSSIKNISINGVKLPPEILNFLMQVAKNGILVQTYGSTEMSIPMCKGIMNEIDINSCGYLNPNVALKVVDAKTGKILKPNESGELCFKSPYIMKGYFKNEEATKDIIDSEEWYHSGDLGYYDASGLVYIHGRIKNTSILPSGKVVPFWEIDRALLLNSDVVECIIVPSSDFLKSFRAFIFVQIVPGSKISEEELYEQANIFHDLKLKMTVKIVDEMPLTSTGKVKLGELKKIVDNYN